MRCTSKISRRDATRGIGLGLLAASLPFGSAHAAYPDNPIKMIVPVPPGSGVDAVSRALGQQMGEQMGTTFVNDYKPGASAVVGTEVLAKSPPDGYTVMTAYTAHATNPLFNPKHAVRHAEGFHADRLHLLHADRADGAPVAAREQRQRPDQDDQGEARQLQLMHRAASAPVRIFPANGSSNRAGLDIQHVPYKGNAPAVNDMLGGHNTLMFDIPSTTVPLVQAGKLKALAVADKKRLPELPERAHHDRARLPRL